MNINRALVKQQAKDIIRGKFFYIFLVSIIVSLLANMSVGFNAVNHYNFNFNNNDFELFKDNKSNHNDFYDYYSNFGDNYYDNYDYDNPIEGFEFNGVSDSPQITELAVNKAGGINALIGGLMGSGLRSVSVLAGIVFAPLTVTLAGMYLSLVRRKPDEPFDLGKELNGIFKNSFNDTYLKKLALVLLKEIILLLLSLLLIVPGVIFFFSSFFAEQIMSDNPKLKPTEAINLSKKMVRGNRTELFVLMLSFIPWYLLTTVTFGLASIYVIPYVETTKALYYENFRMRALQDGRISIDDFKSFDEKVSGFTGEYGNYNYGYTAPTEGSTAYYYAPPQSSNSQTAAGGCYNQPNENAQEQPSQYTEAAPDSSDEVTIEQTENITEDATVEASAETTETDSADE